MNETQENPNPAALAAASIRSAIQRGGAPSAPPRFLWDAPLGGLFVVLRDGEGQIRGSVGTTDLHLGTRNSDDGGPPAPPAPLAPQEASNGSARGSQSENAQGDIGPLLGAVAAHAATADPRFPPLDEEELGACLVEVWLLDAPRPVREEAIQKDEAVLVRLGRFSGLLLPDLFMGTEWSPSAYLRQACKRAGLDARAYLEEPDVEILAFATRRFQQAT